LFGTATYGGVYEFGTVFEITGSGFVSDSGATITKLVASENPVAHGDNVTLTATVMPSTSTGSVTFYDGSTTLGTGVIAGGAASFLFRNPSVGTHLVTAAFEGYVSPPLMLVDVTEPTPNPPIPNPLTGNLLLNPGAEAGTQDWWPPAPMSAVTAPGHTGSYSFEGVNVPGAFITQGVNLAQVTGITLAQVDSGELSANYSFWFADLSPGSGSYGQVTLTFLDANGTPLGQGLSRILQDAGTLSWSNGTGSFPIPSGTRRINYTMDFVTTNPANTGLIDDNVLTISSQALTVTKLVSSENPATHGDSVTLTATVSPSTATGIVTFYDGGDTLGTGALSNGVASLVFRNPSVGTHLLTAAYGGDLSDLPSASPVLTEVDLEPEAPLPISPTALTSNLLLNPGAESGTSNWWPPAPGSEAIPPAHTGNFSFEGTGVPGAFITQGVNLAQVGGITLSQVDSGSLAANYSFWFADLSPGSGTYGQITLTFLDGSGIPLGEGLSARLMDAGSLNWSNGTGAFPIPPGTRRINYTMDFITAMQTNTGSIDDNLLTIGLIGQ
jgi:Bacterial Ig-like domain (group 3)